MMLDAFQILLASGFPVRNYRYLGMGNVFFWDYILFHKLLGIKHLTSVELDVDITQRVNFNRPFGLVNVQMKSIGSALEELSEADRHLVWMDYDQKLSTDMLADAAQAGTRLGHESICIITVDVEPPLLDHVKKEQMYVELTKYYREMAGRLWDHKWTENDFAPVKLYARISELLTKAIESGCVGQKKSLIPIFHFLYRDGDHQMMTIGGMFGAKSQKLRIKNSELGDAVYYRDNFAKPYVIRVPRFTRRERYLLDQAMPRNPRWSPNEFETNEPELESYSEIYRFLPAYAELLL